MEFSTWSKNAENRWNSGQMSFLKNRKCPKSSSSVSPVIWGYEAGHPFEDQAKTLSSCGLKYSLAPGTATWRSFSGRWDTVRQNLYSACNIARKYQAEGVVLTTWGDCGNHQPWATLYPPLFLGSQLVWNGRDVRDEQIGSAVDDYVFNSPSCG